MSLKTKHRRQRGCAHEAWCGCHARCGTGILPVPRWGGTPQRQRPGRPHHSSRAGCPFDSGRDAHTTAGGTLKCSRTARAFRSVNSAMAAPRACSICSGNSFGLRPNLTCRCVLHSGAGRRILRFQSMSSGMLMEAASPQLKGRQEAYAKCCCARRGHQDVRRQARR
jgi:hypothetical protein